MALVRLELRTKHGDAVPLAPLFSVYSQNYQTATLLPWAEEEIEVATVRYKHALRRLQAAIPEAVPELVLEPRMATEQNSAPCPYGFGRLVRRPWELHLECLGYCSPHCMCEALLGARNETVCCSGVGWGKYGTPWTEWYGLPGGPDDPGTAGRSPSGPAPPACSCRTPGRAEPAPLARRVRT